MSVASPSLFVLPDGDEPHAWDWVAIDERLRPRLVRLAVHRYGFRPSEAEDLVQDVFVQVWARRPRVRCPEAYLRTSFHHRCADAIAAAVRRPERHAAPLHPGIPDRCGAEAILNACAVRAAFLRLSGDCRALVGSYIVEGNSLAETARKFDASVNAIWKRVNRCLRKLIEWLT